MQKKKNKFKKNKKYKLIKKMTSTFVFTDKNNSIFSFPISDMINLEVKEDSSTKPYLHLF